MSPEEHNILTESPKSEEELRNLSTRCPYHGKNLAARQRLRAAFFSRLSARTSIVRDRIGKHRKQTELSPRRLMQMLPGEREQVLRRHAAF
jgi:hypothetical protein